MKRPKRPLKNPVSSMVKKTLHSSVINSEKNQVNRVRFTLHIPCS